MIKAPGKLQDLRRRIYTKAKADKAWRFWGLYVHVCKLETLQTAYKMTRRKDGAPGVDGVTFEAIEEGGLPAFLGRLRDELLSGTYRPLRNRKKAIPKGGGKVRILGIPAIRDRVVQGALKLILEPIFEADFQEGSFGYRPGRSGHEAVERVARGVIMGKTRVIDVDLSAYFDNIRHDRLLRKVAERVSDDQVLRLLKLILKAGGKRGVPQGGVISPLLANLYLNEVDRMLERAKAITRQGGKACLEYVRWADDLIILVHGHPRWDWIQRAVHRRLLEELAKLDVRVNEEKSRTVDLTLGDSFGFLGFNFRRMRTRRGKWGVRLTPQLRARTRLLRELKLIFRGYRSQPIGRVIEVINPKLRGWVNYFRVGHSSACFLHVRRWVEQKVRRHLMRARQRPGFGWKRWSTAWLYADLGLYDDYRIRYYQGRTARPALAVT